ncbi:polysaccharide deacetylase family protein [Halobacillus rhizosphaerae]|uniref:polysaccharide deacetylase family protein n=1 Tax=Halobacillus rhizosphaerae TaxID=3064889 RepID=UPI00398AE1D3
MKRIQQPEEGPGVYLTFDDGPDPLYTPKLLDLLNKYQVPCVFFVVGERAQMYPDLIRRMNAEGHALGIHHYQHKSSWFIGPYSLKKQIVTTGNILEEITGLKPVYYRPPWGHFNLFSPAAARNFQVVMWDVIAGDWKVGPREQLLTRLMNKVRDGSIVVLHDCGETLGADSKAPAVMIEALEAFILKLKDSSFQFKRLEDRRK